MATSRKIILSNGGYVGYVVVADDLMLSDLRNQINEQVDDCVMPPDYRFEAGALGPVSIKQEALAIDDFHTVKWLCDEEAKRSGSPDICVVGSNEETKTNSKTKSASSRVGPGFVSPPASKRANEGNGKSSKGRLGGLPKMILIGGSNFELKWLSTHEDAEKLAVRAIELHATGHQLCEEIDCALRTEGFMTTDGKPWKLDDPGVVARILYRNGIWPTSVNRKASVESKCNKGAEKGGHGATFVVATHQPGVVGIVQPSKSVAKLALTGDAAASAVSAAVAAATRRMQAQAAGPAGVEEMESDDEEGAQHHGEVQVSEAQEAENLE